MAYVHCHDCPWAQDDFYSIGGYNPAYSLMHWMESLTRDNVDEQFSDDPEFLKRNGPITKREVIAREFERYAKNIREMKWITFDQYKNDPDKRCPKCGSDNLDVD